MPWAIGCLCATLVAGAGIGETAGFLDDNATAGSDRPEMRAARPGCPAHKLGIGLVLNASISAAERRNARRGG